MKSWLWVLAIVLLLALLYLWASPMPEGSACIHQANELKKFCRSLPEQDCVYYESHRAPILDMEVNYSCLWYNNTCKSRIACQ